MRRCWLGGYWERLLQGLRRKGGGVCEKRWRREPRGKGGQDKGARMGGVL